jgi:hypothetical protein
VIKTASRLILISAGNIRDGISKAAYPFRNETESIENPAQAWNAITVGAYTEKTTIVDPTYVDWEPVAPAGDLCPSSRTSVMWERQWPIKPEIVLEGGNWAALEDQCDCPDDLGILTTYRDPNIRHFDIFRDTSAATAMASNLAGKILGVMPQRWPETIRAMIVHSAEWTAAMRDKFDAATSEQQKRVLLRKYGYGVSNYERAVLSAANDLTLIAEDELQLFWKDGSVIKPATWTFISSHGHGQNSNSSVKPRWSFVLPSRTTWSRIRVSVVGCAGAATHRTRFGLRLNGRWSRWMRFALASTLLWLLKRKGWRRSMPGQTIGTWGESAMSGRFTPIIGGTAAELAQRSAVGVYPIGGWWKENPAHERYDRKIRYALIVSIRALNGAIDIYTPVRVQITAPIEITG